MHGRLLAAALALAGGLSSQTFFAQPGGAVRSLAAGERVFGSNGQGAFEIRGGALVEIAAPAHLVTSTVAIATVSNDIRVAALDGGKSVLIGGSGADVATRAVTARDGSVYIVGNTDSTDFPVTNSTRARGGQDGFLLKLDAELNTVYATYLGGAGHDDFQDLAVDAGGSAFVAASSASAELAPGAHGSGTYVRAGDGFAAAGAESFRATVQAWLAPADGALFAATAGQGLFRSGDRGQTWTRLNLAELNATALAGDGQTLYAGTPRALYRSTNGGASWSESAAGSEGGGIRALAASPRDPNIVYAVPRRGCGLRRSTDGGRTWQAQLASEVCVAAMVAGGADVFAFSADAVYQSGRRVGALANTVAAALDGSALYAATSTGVARSGDGGATWTELFRAAGVTSISIAAGRVWIGTADQGVLASDDGGAVFSRADEAVVRQPVRSLIAADGYVAAGADYLPDLYVAKVGPRGDSVVFSAFVGGLGSETSARLALDGAGGVIVAATTDSADLVASLEAAQRRPAGGSADLFAAKLSASFDLVALTYLGGSGRDALGAIAVDSRSFVYLVGTTASPDLAASPNASRKGLDGAAAAPFLAALSPSLGSIVHLTYTAGSTGDSIAVAGGDVWMGGASNPEAAALRGDGEGFVARFVGLVSFGAITAVRNGASLAAGPVAPSSTVVIEGAGFGGSVFGTTVRMGDSEAGVARVSDARIEVTAPADLQPGSTAAITVTSRTGLFQGSAAVAAVSPGVFSANGDGTGVVLASLLRTDSDNVTTVTSVYECADEGNCAAIPVDLGDEDDQLFLLIRATGVRGGREVTVEMNGSRAEVISFGALDSFSGVDQIVVKLPRSAAGEVTIRVTVDGQPANAVSMRIG